MIVQNIEDMSSFDLEAMVDALLSSKPKTNLIQSGQGQVVVCEQFAKQVREEEAE